MTARWCSCPAGAASISANMRRPISSGRSRPTRSSRSSRISPAAPKSWTIEELAQWGGIGGLGPVFVGSPSTIADILQDWVEETDVDGFNLAYAVTPESFEDVVNHLVPELQKRGVYPTAYRPGTLREKLFGDGPLSAGQPSGRRLSRHRGGQARAAAQQTPRPNANPSRPEPIMPEPILQLRDVSLSFKGVQALSALELRCGARRNLRADRPEWRRQELASQCHQRRLSRRFRRHRLRRTSASSASVRSGGASRHRPHVPAQRLVQTPERPRQCARRPDPA